MSRLSPRARRAALACIVAGGAAASATSVQFAIAASTPSPSATPTPTPVPTPPPGYYGGIPLVDGLIPSTGPAAGGNQITVFGSFPGPTEEVDFGGKSIESYSAGGSEIVFDAPPGAAGSTADVVVKNDAGSSTTSASTTYTYASGPADTTPPSTPTGLALTPTPGGINPGNLDLSWKASTDDVGVVGYDIVITDDQGRSGTLHLSGTSTVHSIFAGLGTTTYTVSARDAWGNVSAPSAPIRANPYPGVTPTPLPTPTSTPTFPHDPTPPPPSGTPTPATPVVTPAPTDLTGPTPTPTPAWQPPSTDHDTPTTTPVPTPIPSPSRTPLPTDHDTPTTTPVPTPIPSPKLPTLTPTPTPTPPSTPVPSLKPPTPSPTPTNFPSGPPTPSPSPRLPTPTFVIDPTPPVVTPTVSPTPTPDLGGPGIRYAVGGNLTLKNLVKGSIPISAVSQISAGFRGGTFSSGLVFSPATANLTALGFLPVTATVNIQPTSNFTGTFAGGALAPTGAVTATTTVRIQLPSIKTFGITIGGGANCQTAQVSTLNLANVGLFKPATGGTLAGTFAISNLTGCGALNGVVSPLTSGNGNTISLVFTPQS